MKMNDFLLLVPKTDLHLHLDGSLRIPTLIELAHSQKCELPSYTEEGLLDTVFKESYQDLGEYLTGFAYTTRVMQDPESLERIACELAWDCARENVRYIEVRFAPQLHVNPRMNLEQVLCAVDKGLRQAQTEINAHLAEHGDSVLFQYGIIVCAMRMFASSFSWYSARMMNLFSESKPKEIFRLASRELVRGLIRIRDRFGLPIVGFDLAGQEDGYPAVDHREAYELAHRHFVKKTVHAGEAYGPESIFQAITELHADRIGHGLHLYDKRLLSPKNSGHGDSYIQNISQYLADRRITIEICLSSNMQTHPEMKTLSEHPFGHMLRDHLSLSLCTDNRTVSRTNSTREFTDACQTFNLDLPQLRNIVAYGFKRSFYPGSYTEKRQYVRQVLDRFDDLAAKVEEEKS